MAVASERDRLVDQAIALAGSDDFGEPTWQEGLDRLLDDIAANGRLNELGVTVFEGDVVGYLVNRLGIVEHRRRHPAVAAAPVERPIVIVGQPRTGTTILHDLLAQDPAHRAPLTWEVDRPCPLPTPEDWAHDPRIEEVDETLGLADQVVPGFTAFHPMGARLAQECVRITGSEFRSVIFPTQYRVPDYDRWVIHEADMAPAYRWHRTFLQHLQSGYPARRWLLKSPAHMWHLGELLAQYPDAFVVQTHRDPLNVIASVSALVAHLRRMASDETSVPEAAEQYVDDIVLGLDRTVAARVEGVVPAQQVVDVQFRDFMADPLAAVGGIYDRMGVALSASTEAAMRGFLDAHPGDGGGSGSRYTFSATGLDADELRSRVAPYQDYFGVESEPLR